ncbi:MAG: aminobenzoate oxygenase, partial [Catenulispora sp.]
DLTTMPLPKQILAYVMQDEARHVAFGRLALRDYYKELTRAELDEREEFVVEGCYLMRDRLNGSDVYDRLGLPKERCLELNEHSDYYQAFRNLLFTRIVPTVRDIGLWGPRVREAYAAMGVLDHAAANVEDLMKADEDLAERLDREKRFAAEEAARAADVAAVIESAKD